MTITLPSTCLLDHYFTLHLSTQLLLNSPPVHSTITLLYTLHVYLNITPPACLLHHYSTSACLGPILYPPLLYWTITLPSTCPLDRYSILRLSTGPLLYCPPLVYSTVIFPPPVHSTITVLSACLLDHFSTLCLSTCPLDHYTTFCLSTGPLLFFPPLYFTISLPPPAYSAITLPFACSTSTCPMDLYSVLHMAYPTS